MPTYEYACRDCGERLEVVQTMSEDPLTQCPNCAGTLRKVFSPVGIAFKGSGFYRTDSRLPKREPSSSNGSNGSGKNGDGTSSGGDGEKSTPAAAGSESSS